jgi:hypothetical protein
MARFRNGDDREDAGWLVELSIPRLKVTVLTSEELMPPPWSFLHWR